MRSSGWTPAQVQPVRSPARSVGSAATPVRELVSRVARRRAFSGRLRGERARHDGCKKASPMTPLEVSRSPKATQRHSLAWSRPLDRVPPRRSLAPRLVSAVLALCALGTLQGAHVAFREDELLCEEAVARLRDCCSEADLRYVSCTYSAGCETSSPNISPSDSRCIRSRSCVELQQQGTCEALAALVSPAEDGLELDVCR